MEYKKGFTIKPKEILNNGVVVFTDGTDDVSPNQISCEAYGYKWDRANNVCYGFDSNFKVNKLFKNTTNTNIGAQNSIEAATMTTLINGSNNTTKGNNVNILINGEAHEVESEINNASILGGIKGKLIRRGEVVIGGGSFANLSGQTQMSFVQCSNKTTDATATKLRLQYITDNDAKDYINVQANSLVGLEAHILAIVTGGSSGTAGHYKYIKLKAGVLTNNSLGGTITQSQATVASTGTSGTATLITDADGYIAIQVTGTANVNIEWSANIHLYELKTDTVEL
tara:strand:+ start:6951 stop:7802 length:852 start_codon:yes stop_codon:yes gene_type:complete